MLTLLLLLSPEARAVPLDLCVNKGGGPLAGLGGMYSWESDSHPDADRLLSWPTLCGVGQSGEPRPVILQPTDGFVVNPSALPSLAVAADAGDPDHGWGRCEWSVEVDGERVVLPVRLPGGTRSRGSLPWSPTNPICAGVASLTGLSAGRYTLAVAAQDLYGRVGDDEVSIRINDTPRFVLDTSQTVFLAGESFEAQVEIDDDTIPVPGSVVTLTVFSEEDPVTWTCEVGAWVGPCTTTIQAPTTPGPFEVVVSYVDEDGWEGVGAYSGYYANDVPGVVILSPAEGELIETGTATEIVVQVTDATASPGAFVDLEVAEASGATWSGGCELENDLSCAVDYTPATNGPYAIAASYTDDWGSTGTAGPLSVEANDTPTIAVAGLPEVEVVEPGIIDGIVVSVADNNLAGGSLLASVDDGSASTLVALMPDVFGDAATSLELPDIGVYTVVYTFTDDHGVSVSTAPATFVTNFAPTVALIAPTAGSEVTVPVGDSGRGVDTSYTFTFDVADGDDAVVAVQPAEGRDAYVSCDLYGSGGLGEWECTLDVGGWAPGSYPITVLVTDDYQEAETSFIVEAVSDLDYDFDGDGVVEADTAVGAGWGDCAPDDPSIHGASADMTVAAAAEVCDELDNDCDGLVNGGLPDADDDTMGTAKPITGHTQVLASGASISDEGSLGEMTDEDWWYFEVDVDEGSRTNASFLVTLRVPSADSLTPAGVWEVVAASASSRYPVPSPREVTIQSSDCSTVPGECTLVWSVVGDPDIDAEWYWRLQVTSSTWDADMCTEVESAPTYALTVTN